MMNDEIPIQGSGGAGYLGLMPQAYQIAFLTMAESWRWAGLKA